MARVVVALIAVTVWGCGGKTVDGPDEGSSGAAGTSRGGTSPIADPEPDPAPAPEPQPAPEPAPAPDPPQPEPDPPQLTDPQYPYVEWSEGNGYEKFCPPYAGGWGMLCWHFDGVDSRFCENGPDCNVCSCAIPCGDNTVGVDACLPGASGSATPECIEETPNSVGNCMLTCDQSGPCPNGMVCVPYVGLERSVCMWLSSGLR